MNDANKTQETELGTRPNLREWGIFALGLSSLTVVLDQWTKYAATRFFKMPMNVCEIYPNPGFKTDFFWVMDVSLVCNFGISWGLLQGDSPIKRWALTGFAFVMCVVLVFLFRQSRDNLTRASLGLVMGGAIGNGIDRFLFGAVTDFIDFGDIGFHWVFNIADSAITVGVIGLILASFRQDRLEKALKS
ncbi:MAG: signal peptidase II [Litorimonas sp.]